MEDANHFSQRKIALAQWLLGLNSEQVLAQMEAFVLQSVDGSHSSEIFTAQEVAEIAKGEADYQAGRVISLEDFKMKLNQYEV